MPNIKSAKKRVEIAAVRNEANSMKSSALKTHLKKATTSLAAGEANKEVLSSAIKALDESVTKGLIHKNQAARRKSRLTKKFNAVSAAK